MCELGEPMFFPPGGSHIFLHVTQPTRTGFVRGEAFQVRTAERPFIELPIYYGKPGGLDLNFVRPVLVIG